MLDSIRRLRGYPVQHKLERGLEWLLFSSRWLLAPLYLGMAIALVAILVVFFRELFREFTHLDVLDSEKVILLSLSLIDLSLTGSLLLIVILSGYENFVSKMDVGDHEDRPDWMGSIDFSGLKIKIVASIVAISAIALLRTFLPLADAGAPVDGARIGWMLAIHLTFVITGVLLALMDWVTSRTPGHVQGGK